MEMEMEMEIESRRSRRENRGQRAFISIDIRQLSYIHFNHLASTFTTVFNGMMMVAVNVNRKECSLSSTKLANHPSHHSSG
ncbi:hypothetical protein EAF00_008919 [Botryotinia globosa]|nr:hypothetical protein EAF00_008919 [Botryotinia globosa]